MSGRRMFATWLQARLRERHMTQAELARQLNVQPATVNRWLREHRQPDPRSVEELALVFGLPVDEVMVIAGVLSEERARSGPRCSPRHAATVPSGPPVRLMHSSCLRFLAHGIFHDGRTLGNGRGCGIRAPGVWWS